MSPRAGSSAAAHLALPAVTAGQGKLVPRSGQTGPQSSSSSLWSVQERISALPSPRGGKPVLNSLIFSQIPGNLAHLSGFDKYQLCRGHLLCCGTSPLLRS